jgi:hypothetical protein
MQRMKVFMLMAGLTALLVVLGGAIGGQQGMMCSSCSPRS